jgi:hypothetical protein
MTGGLLELVANNYDNTYLTDLPQVTHFKLVYRQTTNFSLCEIGRAHV